MVSEPKIKRTVAFVDGQNLFHSAKEAFGYKLPNYDLSKLVPTVCHPHNWTLVRTHFYTGMPAIDDNEFWHRFWSAKLAAMGRQGIQIFSRALRYRNQSVTLPDGKKHTFLVGQEKGVDIRIALDVVRTIQQNECDVALIFSQDQDLSEVADEIRLIAQQQKRWIKVASAFPVSPTTKNKRGINKTDWIRIERSVYDSSLDSADFCPPEGTVRK